MPLTLQQPPNLVLLPLLQLLVEYVYGIEAHPGFAYPELIVESLLNTARVLHGIYLCMCEAHPDFDDYTHQLAAHAKPGRKQCTWLQHPN